MQLSGNDVGSVGCAERKFLAGVRAVKSPQTWRLTGTLGEPVKNQSLRSLGLQLVLGPLSTRQWEDFS